MKILVTGANGFIGSAVIKSLIGVPDISLAGLVRAKGRLPNFQDVKFIVCDLENLGNNSNIFFGYDVIIHCAGHAHINTPVNEGDIRKYYEVNTQSTINIGKLAVRAGVKRVIFLSSIKVNGEHTVKGNPFTILDEENPKDVYGLSKYKAEIGLKQIASASNLEFTIIRIPLVYGADMKGNLSKLLSIIEWRIPLPLALATDNVRSLIGIDNLVSFIKLCIHHPFAANETFLVSDNQDLSTYDILQLLGSAAGKPVILFKFPIGLLKIFAITTNLRNKLMRLLGNLQIDNEHVFQTTKWQPPYSVQDGFKKIKQVEDHTW